MDEPKVLIVDDDPGCRMLLAELLSCEPYRLLEAGNGSAAMEVVSQEMPDLILLDVRMPAQDGLAILRRLKEDDRTRHIPVIMVTALAEDENITQCLDAGAVDHVGKPFSESVVRARVRVALRNRPTSAIRTQKPGKLIGFVGAKGGVGTTTTAVNVALALQSLGRSVAVVELRSYVGTVPQHLGVSAARNLQPLLDRDRTAALNPESLAKCLTQHPTGLNLLLAPPKLDDDREMTPQQAHDILKALAAVADFVIVDLPCWPSRVNRVALQCCDFVALIIALDPGCLAAAPVMSAWLAAWGVGGDTVGAVLVSQHAGTNSPDTVQSARTQLNCRIISVIPPAADLCLTALKSGLPLVRAMPDSPEGQAFHQLASRLIMDPVPELTY